MSTGSASTPEGAADPTALFVVVSGPPGSGKSTLSSGLASTLGLSLLSKDTIKEALLARLPAADIAASRELGRASVDVLLSVAMTSRGAVLDSVWHRHEAAERLRALPGLVVEVHCRVPAEVARRRYAERTGSRAAGFFDDERGEGELVNEQTANPVNGGWPVIVVDTSASVDIDALTKRIRSVAGGVTYA